MRIVATLASVTFAICAACQVSDHEEFRESLESVSSELMFAPGDPDISWSGPATYSEKWARILFDKFPGLYVYNDGQTILGTIYLSAAVSCQFDTYQEPPGRMIVQSSACSGMVNNLAVFLDCQVLGDQSLACTGSLDTGSGHHSIITVDMASAVVCAPDGCFEGPFEPHPTPNTDGTCPEGENPCGVNLCCPEGYRCGDLDCWKPVEDVSIQP